VRSWSRQLLARHFRRICRRDRPDLYHEPNYIPLPTDLPTVATVHDLSLLLHPEWHPGDRAAYFERHFPAALGQCRQLIAGSEFTRQEMIRHLHVPPQRVTRVYYGMRADLAPAPAARIAPVLERLGIPQRYLLYVGTIEPRKNLLLLLKAYTALPPPVREGCPLVLAGRWGWNVDAVRDYWHAEARHRGVMHLGYVADEDLPALYAGARGLVYPSLYEGFGLPPLEMMAAGGAVLASTAEAIREVVGPHGLLVPPHDQDGWRTAMLCLMTDDDFWQSLRKGVVDWARRYSWTRCARETHAVYRLAQCEPARGASKGS
jgi:alpha-1,3-rhamnosyl/mannosyltransferase